MRLIANSRTALITAVMLATGAAAIGPAIAQQDQSVEAKLRTALRQATQQQRALEDEVATLRAKQQQADRTTQEATAKLADQGKQLEKLLAAQQASNEENTKLREAVAELGGRLKGAEQSLVQAEATLNKWKTAYNEAANIARTRDADAKLLKTQLDQSTQRVGACETNNEALFKLGNEILTMYEGKGPLTALLEREPLTQIKRVALENLVQDYQDKLIDNRTSMAPRQ